MRIDLGEDSGQPRLYRDGMVGGIWLGSRLFCGAVLSARSHTNLAHHSEEVVFHKQTA